MGKPDKTILRTDQHFQPLQFSQRLFRVQRVEVEFRQRGDDRMRSLAEQRQLRRGRSGPSWPFPPQHLPLQQPQPLAGLLAKPGMSGHVLQSVVPLSGPGSGVPVTPTCHSAFVGNRLPALAHASCAWNQLMRRAGISPGRLTA